MCDILDLMALEFLCVVHMRKYSEEHFNLFLSMKCPMKVKGVQKKQKIHEITLNFTTGEHLFSVLFPKRKKSNRFGITKRVSI